MPAAVERMQRGYLQRDSSPREGGPGSAAPRGVLEIIAAKERSLGLLYLEDGSTTVEHLLSISISWTIVRLGFFKFKLQDNRTPLKLKLNLILDNSIPE
jgi:hypothetical protein